MMHKEIEQALVLWLRAFDRQLTATTDQHDRLWKAWLDESRAFYLDCRRAGIIRFSGEEANIDAQ